MMIINIKIQTHLLSTLYDLETDLNSAFAPLDYKYPEHLVTEYKEST